MTSFIPFIFVAATIAVTVPTQEGVRTHVVETTFQASGFEQSGQIDPIVTGRRVTREHQKRWLEMKQQFQSCPDCVDQPFPELTN